MNTPVPRTPVRTGRPSRRTELMSIAADLFAERGFANVTVDDIGEAAGISGPALYHHFRGKEALLGEMLVGISRHLLDAGTRLARDHPSDSLDHLIAFHCEFALDDRSLITVHFRDLLHATADDQRRVRQLQARYVSIWVAAVLQRSPGADRRTAIAAVHAMFGLINSTPYSARVPRARMLQLLSSMAAAALHQIDHLGTP